MIKTETKQKLEDALSEFIGTGDINTLKWIIENDTKNQTKLFGSEKIIEKFWESFERSGANDKEIFQHLAKNTPKKSSKIIGGLFSELIKSEDQNKYSTLLEIINDKSLDWPDSIMEQLHKACLDTALKMNNPQSGPLFEAVINSISGTASELLESIEKKVSPWILKGENKSIISGIKILEAINNKLNPYTPPGYKEILERVQTFLESNSPAALPLLNYLFKYITKIPYNKQDDIVELMKNQLTVEKPNNIRLIALTFVPIMIQELSRYDVLQNEIVNMAINVKEADAKQECQKLLKQFQKRLTSSQEDKIKQTFGKDFFK